ncbi:MAG: ABC transporter ATP-binding protein [Caldilineae bacterium]|nr:MAG: ABC transporter ATP-binding protein [Caldilineae bacterium]
MSHVELSNIVKRFPGVTALKGISFDVRDGEFFVLLGPTGAGKTTTLRIIAGLTKQDEGTIRFDGESVDALTPAERDTAFVFQQYSLYPTMTVFDNLAFPLRAPSRRLPEDEIRKRVEVTAEKLRISHLLDRKTAHLSGGEMQRVSIGRAIVREPRIFLMDEPLSNLDAKLREALRVELQHLQKVEGSTTLFVTHDQIEALTMADRIAVLDLGRIRQIGTPEDIYDRPADTFVAQLVGTPRINLFPARRENNHLYIEGSELHLPAPTLDLPERFTLGIRPEDITPSPDGAFAGTLQITEPLGVETILHIRSGERTLQSLIPGMTDLRIGDTVRFDLVQDRLHCFDLDGKRIN